MARLMYRVQQILGANVLCMLLHRPGGPISVTCPTALPPDALAFLRAYDWSQLAAGLNTPPTAASDPADTWITLDQLRHGALFETRDGVRAVKTEYLNGAGDQPQCVLLASGEYATFPERGATLVRKVMIK